jgi:hypothetical protein
VSFFDKDKRGYEEKKGGTTSLPRCEALGEEEGIGEAKRREIDPGNAPGSG